ncbi:MAG: hypothetical protein ACRDZ7_18255 [Acidimicrobiia bacterium]
MILALFASWLLAYGPTKTEPESALNIVIGVASIVVFAGVLFALRARGRRAAGRRPPPE